MIVNAGKGLPSEILFLVKEVQWTHENLQCDVRINSILSSQKQKYRPTSFLSTSPLGSLIFR